MFLLLLFVAFNCYGATDAEKLEIKSDSLSFNKAKNLAIYKGNVSAKIDNKTISAKELYLYFNSQEKVDLAEAKGNAQLDISQTTENITATANTIKYFVNQDKISFIQNATIKTNTKNIAAEIIDYYPISGNLETHGAARQSKIVWQLESKS